MLHRRSFLAAASLTFAGARQSRAQGTTPFRIAVSGDMSGMYQDVSGPGQVVAVRMAVQDAGGHVLGRPIEVLSADDQNKAVVLLLGWRIVPAIAGTAVVNERFYPKISRLCGNRCEFPGGPTAQLRAGIDTNHAAMSSLKHAASPGRAVSATAPIRLSAQWSGRLATWATPASTGTRMLIGSRRVPGRRKPG
jgi:hypothetical protein